MANYSRITNSSNVLFLFAFLILLAAAATLSFHADASDYDDCVHKCAQHPDPGVQLGCIYGCKKNNNGILEVGSNKGNPVARLEMEKKKKKEFDSLLLRNFAAHNLHAKIRKGKGITTTDHAASSALNDRMDDCYDNCELLYDFSEMELCKDLCVWTEG